MVPCVVIDTETTGFPSKRGRFRARIIELGAVVITEDRRVVSPISFYVRQPRSHLTSWQAQKAMGVHGIGVSDVLRDGLEEDLAAPRLARWIERVQERFGVTEVRAYNQAFDFWFLEQSPWDFFARTGLVQGEDIMQTARRAMDCSAGPKLSKALTFANRTGDPIPWLGDAHRAGEDARMAAMLAIRLGSQEA
jgi:DNA polymerase III epsilon subunit-like protein